MERRASRRYPGFVTNLGGSVMLHALFWSVFSVATPLGSTAHAFCGTYAGRPGDELVNESSRVVVAIDEVYDTTTLTLDMDVSGAEADFGVVIPVPAGTDPSDVQTVDRALIDALMHWAGPRAVEYSCDDAEKRWGGAGCALGGGADHINGVGCGASDASMLATFVSLSSAPELGETGAGPAVTVEHTFALAEYDLAILSSDTGDALQAWLDEEGFVLPDGAADLFDTYLREDAWFVAVRVSIDAPIEDGAWLTPLQIVSHGTAAPTVPIRVGTLSSKGTQEVLVGMLTTGGVPGISTFPEATLDNDCLLPPDTTLTEQYADNVDQAIDSVGGSGWVLEHSWPLSVKCDPCPPPSEVSPFSTDDLRSLGLAGALDGRVSPRISRLRVRYDPAEVRTDLAFYDSGVDGTHQTRLIQGQPELEYLFPVCGQGFADEPRECPDPVELKQGTSLPLLALLGPLGLLGAGLRRRS